MIMDVNPVIDVMLDIVPSKFKEYELFRRACERIKDNTMLQTVKGDSRLGDLIRVIDDYLPKLNQSGTPDWRVQIDAIMTGKIALPWRTEGPCSSPQCKELNR